MSTLLLLLLSLLLLLEPGNCSKEETGVTVEGVEGVDVVVVDVDVVGTVSGSFCLSGLAGGVPSLSDDVTVIDGGVILASLTCLFTLSEDGTLFNEAILEWRRGGVNGVTTA